jgi:hypothetical protein
MTVFTVIADSRKQFNVHFEPRFAADETGLRADYLRENSAASVCSSLAG